MPAGQTATARFGTFAGVFTPNVLTMQKPDRGAADAYGDRLQEIVEPVGTVLLVHNARPRDDLLHL